MASFLRRINAKKVKETRETVMGRSQSNLFVVHAAEQLLSNKIAAQRIKDLGNLVSVVKEDYEKLYLKSINLFAEYVQQLPDNECNPYHCTGGLLQHALDRVIAVLKLRRGYMLPPGSDTETCYKEQNAWTLALFAASLFQDCWQIPINYEVVLFQGKDQIRIWDSFAGISMPISSSLSYRFRLKMAMEKNNQKNNRVNKRKYKSLTPMLIKTIIPMECINLLYQFNDVFENWFDHINGMGGGNNPITEIINRAELVIFDSFEKQELVVIPTDTKFEKSSKCGDKINKDKSAHEEWHEAKNKTENETKNKKSELHYNTQDNTQGKHNNEQKEVVENKIEEAVSKADEIESSNEFSKESDLEQIIKPKTAKVQLEDDTDVNIDVKKEFIGWLKTNIEENKLSINKLDSLVHIVEIGVLLVMPTLLSMFLKSKPQIKTILQQLNSIDLIDGFLTKITATNLFVKNQQNDSFIHEYYRGDWNELNFTSGFVIQPKYVFDKNTNPEISRSLKEKPRL